MIESVSRPKCFTMRFAVTGPMPLTLASIRQAPKALLHDHLDGGLRPATVLELAADCGYDDLPADNETELAAWFRDAAD